ncbi:hypothetical protein [Rhizobium sp. 2MFCol3.1]|uniref:hypothetical protein n=1 Tax=unclassified Rhizobium TaxID=2613769 RepID=UPI00036D5AEE|nr:hypothetical protein [Rhizobium sp. 2MFCol3.1]
MSNALEFKADLEDVDSDKSKLQFAQGGNPDLLKPMKQSDAHLVVQDTDDRTLMMLQAFEGRA